MGDKQSQLAMQHLLHEKVTRKCCPYYLALRTVPNFAAAYTFCVSEDIWVSYG